MDAFANFAYSTVVAAPSPPMTGALLTVALDDGARYPFPPFNVVICPADALPLGSNAEIARVTGIVGDTLTILRAQEGSTARAIIIGDQIFASVTKKTLDDLVASAGVPGPPGPQGPAGSDATLPTAPVGQVLVSQGAGTQPIYSPRIVLIDPSAASGTKRWEIRISGTDLVFDSQSDAGVSYGRPFAISAYGAVNAPADVITVNGNLTSFRGVQLMEISFAGRPSIGAGGLANFNDSTVNTPGAVVAGGGSFHVLARYNGTNWIVIGG